MLDEFLKQISDTVEKGRERESDQGRSINIVVGNGSTVVIGNGSISQGGKEEEEEGGDDCCHQQGACAQGYHRELRRLRRKVRMLRRLLNARGGSFKRPLTAGRTVRIPSVTKRPARPVRQNVANHKRAASLMPPRATSPITAGFSSPRPTSTHINSGISDLMSPHSRTDQP